MPNPRRMSVDEVQAMIVDLAAKMPAELTLRDMLPELIGAIAAASDRITLRETSSLIGVAAVMAKVCAAGDFLTSTQIKAERGTCQ